MSGAKFAGASIAFILTLIAVVVTCCFFIDRYSCAQLQETTGYDTQYPSIWTGCQVKVDGRWIPKDTWRNFGDGS